VSVLVRWAFAVVIPCLAIVLPTRTWYSAAFRISKALGPVFRLRRDKARESTLHEARLLNRLLALFTRTGRAFPIPVCMRGFEILLEEKSHGRGVVLCSAHLPLIKVALRALIQSGHGPTAVIAEYPGADDQVAAWGLRERTPALRTGPKVLIKVRTLLRSGGTLFLLLDRQLGADYSANVLELVRRTGSRAVFVYAELLPDGQVQVSFRRPPAPDCSGEGAILRNLQVLESDVLRILRLDGNTGPAVEQAA
jgi:lauroyl/myristoyl acyltransferase